FLTGTLQLRDHVNLYLEAGSEIKGSPDMDDYPATDYMSEKRNRFLLYAHGAKNISITGRGAINGNDSAFIDWNSVHPGCCADPAYIRQGHDYTNRFPDGPAAIKGDRPGILVALIKCEQVLIKNIVIKNAPNWSVHLAGCNKATISGVTVDNSLLVPNADGFDVSVSRNVLISDCNISAGDDGIAISPCGDGFSASPAENIHVSNCHITSRSAGIRLGWSENHIRNCTFTNLTIHSNRGICINTRHNEVIENILFSDIIIETRLHSGWWGSAEPIHISEIPLGELHGISSEGKTNGIIRNIRFNNMLITAEAGMVFYGHSPSSIQHIQLNNIAFRFKESQLNKSYGGNLELRPVFDDRLALFKSDIPALFMKHVNNVKIDGLSVERQGKLEDFHTHAIYAENFENIAIKSFEGASLKSEEEFPAIFLKEGSHVTLQNCTVEGKLYEAREMKDNVQLIRVNGVD
ncbi:MAG: glycosyl hydrolase family 28 protein, partial [Mariniphaga sp.]|nr:glycosyl hydrolase family 28 protein [Mariniphaga sp.]